MTEATAALQRWINAKAQLIGAPIKVAVDGLRGPATRQGLYDLMANRKAPAVTPDQLRALAARLGGTLKQLQAVAEVESNGGGFLTTGHPKILWERHYFWKRIQLKIPLLSDPKPGGYTLDADNDGINDSWEKLVDAASRKPISAFESASWGKFQVMGAWWQKLGYPSALEFGWTMRESELAHYEALARYIENFGGKTLFQRLSGNPMDCLPFAKFYNGPAQKGYDQRLAKAMRELR